MQTAAAALVAGEWETARTSFEAALAEHESAEALFGLGSALWWLGETEAAVRAQERAYAEFHRRPDPMAAALTAVGLCLLYRASLGNYAASRGWLGRLARLVEQHAPPLAGWLALCRAVAANDSNEPTDAESYAREALEVARGTTDADLELCALSEMGAALMQKGRITDGTALLDEAMAGALGGEATRLETVVFAGCRTIVSCSRAAELTRARQWIAAADDFTRRYGSFHLYTTCRTEYGSLLFAAGRWEEAERELGAALKIGKAAEPMLYGEALAKLAELRVAQGRIEEAAELVKGLDDHPDATSSLAQIRLRRGEPAVAVRLLDRRLNDFPHPCVDSAPLCELLVEAHVALGDVDAARACAEELSGAEATGCVVVAARAARVLGRSLLASQRHEDAVPQLERALNLFARLEMPLETARTHLLLARALDVRDAAVAEARTALGTFESLGAIADADAAAAFLRSLGIRVSRRAGREAQTLTRRESEVLALLARGLSNRDIAERLFLTPKTVEHHVRSVLSKLGLSNRTEAAAYAVRHLSTDSAPN